MNCQKSYEEVDSKDPLEIDFESSNNNYEHIWDENSWNFEDKFGIKSLKDTKINFYKNIQFQFKFMMRI